MEKTPTDIKSTSARNAGISGRRKRGGRSGGPERKITPHVRSAAKLLSCTTIRSITATTAAVTKSAATLSSCQSLRPSRPHPCPSCLEKQTSSGCAIDTEIQLQYKLNQAPNDEQPKRGLELDGIISTLNRRIDFSGKR